MQIGKKEENEDRELRNGGAPGRERRATRRAKAEDDELFFPDDMEAEDEEEEDKDEMNLPCAAPLSFRCLSFV